LVAGENGRKRLELRDYSVDLGRCLVCGLCAEACPNEALTMAPDYELAALERGDLVAGTARLAAAGRPFGYNNQQRLPEGYGEGRVVKAAPGPKTRPGAVGTEAQEGGLAQ
jgi:formate hydrogenlyase subunit 6/NADH:ubiquinone oxidoreductase subunit I